MSQGPVLVTGACGLVGRATVARLLEDGREVVATDVHTPATAALGRTWERTPGLRMVWRDLTDAAATADLLQAVRPVAVIHLAALIPPLCYRRPGVARAVNVAATQHLVDACVAVPQPPRFVQASSVAVYGARNPHRVSDPVSARTPIAPTDLYGAHKAEAEGIVRGSSLDWVVLRLGGVMSVEQDKRLDLDAVHFGSLLPTDGRIQTVDVRDVARAFAAATTAAVDREILLIGGDATHRLRQREVMRDMTAAAGLEGGIPEGEVGDPHDDTTWFATDWMETTRAQDALDFQRHSWPAMLEEVRRATGRRRHLNRLIAPVLHEVVRRANARRGTERPFVGWSGA